METVYIKEYDLNGLTNEEILEIEQATNKEMEKITKMWFVENIKWLNDMKNKRNCWFFKSLKWTKFLKIF